MSMSDDADQIKVVSKIMHLKWSCCFDTTPNGLFVILPKTPSNHLNLWKLHIFITISLSHSLDKGHAKISTTTAAAAAGEQC